MGRDMAEARRYALSTTEDKIMLEKRFIISLAIIVPSWFIVWYYPQSQSHQVLGTNLLMLVAGYWIGSSKGSQDKDKAMLGLKEG